MSEPKSEEDGILREWAPLSRFLGQIPLTVRKGLFFENVKLTCVDAVEECIVVGTNTGTVFWYDRTNHFVQQFSPEKNNHVTITAVKIVSTVDYMVAAGDSSGVVSIFKIPVPLPDWLQDEIPSAGKSNKAAERFTVSGLHHSSVTSLEFSKNGQKLFSGDSSGLVVFTEIDFFMNLTKARVLLNESHSIVQLSYNQQHSLLVIATLRRCLITRKMQHSWESIQIGQKERTSFMELGGTVFVEEGSNEPAIYSARPGLRLWLAGVSGSVEKTIIFKEGVKECKESAILLSERPLPDSRPVSFELSHILPWVQGLIVTYNKQFLMVLDPQSGKAKSVVAFALIRGLCVTSSEVFLIQSDRDLMRLAFSPDFHDSSIGGVGNIAKGEKVSPMPNFNFLPVTGTMLDVYNSTVGAKPQPSDLPCEVMYGQDTARLPPVAPLQEGVAELRMEPSHHLLFPAIGKQQFDEIIYRKKSSKNKKWRRSYEVQKSKNGLDRKLWSSMNGPESMSSFRHSIDNPLLEHAYEIPSEILTDLTNLEIAIQEVNQAKMEETIASASNQENKNPQELPNVEEHDSSSEVNTCSDNVDSEDGLKLCAGSEHIISSLTMVDEEMLNNNFLPHQSSAEDNSVPVSEYSNGSQQLASCSLDEKENMFGQSCLEMKDEEDTQQDVTSCAYSHINFSELEQCSSVMEAAEMPESLIENSVPPEDFIVEHPGFDEDPTKIPSDISGSPYDINIESPIEDDPAFEPADAADVSIRSRISECEELKDYCFIKREVSDENHKAIFPWLKDLPDLGGGWKELTCPEKGIWISSDGELVFLCQSNLGAHKLGPSAVWEQVNELAEMISVSPNSSLICLVNCGIAKFSTNIKSKNWKQLGLEVGHVSVNESEIWYVSKGDLYHFTLQSGIANLVITPKPLSKIYARDNVVMGLTSCGEVWAKEGSGMGEWKPICFPGYPIAEIGLGPDHLVWLLDTNGSLFVSERTSLLQFWQVVIANGTAIHVTNISVTENLLLAYDVKRSALYINHTVVKGHGWICNGIELSCLQLTAGCLLESQGSLWILAKRNKLYSVTPYSGIYKGIKGVGYGVTCISGMPYALWILTENGNVYIRIGITEVNALGTSWLPLNLEQIKQKKMQLVDICISAEVVWACDIRGHVLAAVGSQHAFERQDSFPPAWVIVDGHPVDNNTFTKVCVGIMSHMVWALDSAGNIYVREGIFSDFLLGTGWVHVKSLKASHLTICGQAVWALTKEGVYKRTGISSSNYIGDDWIFIPGELDNISVTSSGLLWGVNPQSRCLMYHSDKTFPIAKGTYYTDNDWTFI